jgi:hypothetical protein
MIILPINSVVNPLIYDDTVIKLIVVPLRRLKTFVSSCITVLHPRIHRSCSTAEQGNIELELAEIVEERATPNISAVL